MPVIIVWAGTDLSNSLINERSTSLPQSEKARVEVYLPDLPRAADQDLLHAARQRASHRSLLRLSSMLLSVAGEVGVRGAP